jgi:hypothetical protein
MDTADKFQWGKNFNKFWLIFSIGSIIFWIWLIAYIWMNGGNRWSIIFFAMLLLQAVHLAFRSYRRLKSHKSV